MNIPTAEEFIRTQYGLGKQDIDVIALKGSTIVKDMIEFTKLHLQAQQEAILENVEIIYNPSTDERISTPYPEINKDSIINAYDINNIK